MLEPGRTNPDEVKRQLRQHMDSLRAAGIEWLPAYSGDPLPSSAPPNEMMESSPIQPALLFEPPIPAVTESVEERGRELRVLAGCVAECRRCPHLAATRTQTVFGVGPIDPELCFIGEAPGATEDAQGEPFVGEAGQLLNRIINACGMTRAEVYICNIIRCRPPGNRVPNAEEAANCREFLEKQLDLVRPRYICCLGACAAQNLLGTLQSIGSLRGRVLEFKGIPVFCTYHPAYLLRRPDEKKKVWDDMKKLLAHMGRIVPRY
jgi:uracil-DNA glycosylase